MELSDEPEVLVLGGGFAGLTAARDLGERGRRIVLLEARDRLGGRTWTRQLPAAEPGSTVLAEMGGTWFSRRHQPAIAAEIARYGVAVSETMQTKRTIAVSTQGRVEGVTPTEVFADLFAPAQEAIARGVSDVQAAVESGEPFPAHLDINASTWIDGLEVPRETSDQLRSWFATMAGGSPDELSLMGLLGDLAFTGYGLESTFEEVGETFTDGTDTLVQAIRGDIRGEVITGVEVAGLRQDGDRVIVSSTDGRSWSASAAVVALPLNCLGDVAFDPPLDEVKAGATRRGHVGRSTKIMAVTEGFGVGTFATSWGLPIQAAIGMRPAGAGAEIVACFDGMQALEDPNDAAEIEQALQQFVPETRVLQVTCHDWNADPFAKGAWLAWPPGWVNEVVPTLAQPQGRVAFAGSDIALEGGGYIEGAIESGHEAAAYVDGLL